MPNQNGCVAFGSHSVANGPATTTTNDTKSANGRQQLKKQPSNHNEFDDADFTLQPSEHLYLE